VRHGAPVIPDAGPQRAAEFEGFVRESEPRLRRALVAAYGFEEGRDATAEALAYGWEHAYPCSTTSQDGRTTFSSPDCPARLRLCHSASAWWSSSCTDSDTRCTRLPN